MADPFEVLLERLANTLPDVFFVEIGAMDGKSFDSLYATARKHHWRGMLVEPLKDLFQRLKDNYEHDPDLIFENVAISDTVGTRMIYRVPLHVVETGLVPDWAAGISSFYNDRNAIGGVRTDPGEFARISPLITEEAVDCVPLHHLLHKHDISRIDVVQIDTEGHDFHVLKQIDLNFYKPHIIKFEYYNLPTDEQQQSLAYLENFGYRIFNDGMNIVATTLAEQETIQNPSSVTRDLAGSSVTPPRFGISRRNHNILFFVDADRALGFLHAELVKYLHQHQIVADIWDWRRSRTVEEMKLIASNYDYIVTLPGNTWALTDQYEIAHERIVIIAHGEWDLQRALSTRPADEIDRFAGYAVISDFLRQSSAKFGIRRMPSVVRPGVNCARFCSSPPRQLAVVGYGGVFHRDEGGIDIKRGALCQKATENAGLVFKPAKGIHFLGMPGYYRQVDAVLIASLSEGFGLPALEAAAAGRLVISTAVGNFPLQASRGAGIAAPINSEDYERFTTDMLVYYKDHPADFVETCTNIQHASFQFDWKFVIDDWVNFFQQLR